MNGFIDVQECGFYFLKAFGHWLLLAAGDVEASGGKTGSKVKWSPEVCSLEAGDCTVRKLPAFFPSPANSPGIDSAHFTGGKTNTDWTRPWAGRGHSQALGPAS